MKKTVYEKYDVHKIINASGKMTILGGSKVAPSVGEAMILGATNFFLVKELQEKVNELLAKLMHVESSYLVNSASGGIAQSVAASIAGNDYGLIMNPYDVRVTRREIVLAKGHNVNYGTAVSVPIEMGGGKVVEAGFGNECTKEQLEACINENTAAIVYVKSHHAVQKHMVGLDVYLELGKKYSLPVIVDAAAEEDLAIYANQGADVVIYSGTKALEGPTSGLIVGKKAMIDLVKMQGAGIGRVMKVGKESIVGLAQAIENFLATTGVTLDEQRERLVEFNELFEATPGIKTNIVQDAAGREILRSELTFDAAILGKNAATISSELQEGKIKIYTRDYRSNEGKIEIDIRDVSNEELPVIASRIQEIIK